MSNGKNNLLDKLSSDKSDSKGNNDPSQLNDGSPSDDNNNNASVLDSIMDDLLEQASDHNWTGDNPLGAEEIEEVIKEFVNETYAMIDEKTRGLMPSSFTAAIQKINEPPVINWQSILKKYVGTISANYRHTRLKLNRRQPERFDLSGKETQKIIKLVVAIDTSLSMSKKMISYVFNEIFAIMSKKDYEMTIIECDAAIQNVYKIRKPSQIDLTVRGRGGTSFTPVIEYINNDRQ